MLIVLGILGFVAVFLLYFIYDELHQLRCGESPVILYRGKEMIENAEDPYL